MSGGTLNKAIIIGRLGQDPELKYTNTQRAVANFSVATNESWKDNDGNQREITDWHRVVVWDRLAEFVSEWVKKGSLVYIEGLIKTRSWDASDGTKRYTTEINARNIQLLGSKPSGGSGVPMPDEDSAPPQRSSAPQAQAAPSKPKRQFDEPSSEDSNVDDDLPF